VNYCQGSVREQKNQQILDGGAKQVSPFFQFVKVMFKIMCLSRNQPPSKIQQAMIVYIHTQKKHIDGGFSIYCME
jgi:hypothetical protein